MYGLILPSVFAKTLEYFPRLPPLFQVAVVALLIAVVALSVIAAINAINNSK
jgi:hypothetical protein